MKEDFRKLIQSEKILRLRDKDNLLNWIILLENEVKKLKENSKWTWFDFKRNKRQRQQIKIKLRNMEFKM